MDETQESLEIEFYRNNVYNADYDDESNQFSIDVDGSEWSFVKVEPNRFIIDRSHQAVRFEVMDGRDYIKFLQKAEWPEYGKIKIFRLIDAEEIGAPSMMDEHAVWSLSNRLRYGADLSTTCFAYKPIDKKKGFVLDCEISSTDHTEEITVMTLKKFLVSVKERLKDNELTLNEVSGYAALLEAKVKQSREALEKSTKGVDHGRDTEIA